MKNKRNTRRAREHGGHRRSALGAAGRDDVGVPGRHHHGVRADCRPRRLRRPGRRLHGDGARQRVDAESLGARRRAERRPRGHGPWGAGDGSCWRPARTTAGRSVVSRWPRDRHGALGGRHLRRAVRGHAVFHRSLDRRRPRQHQHRCRRVPRRTAGGSCAWRS